MSSSLKTLSDSQLHLLLTKCYCTWHRAILTLLADTGLRVSELVSLRQDDLWIGDAPVTQLEVRAAIAKNKTPRSIPLTLLATDAVRDLRAALWLRCVTREPQWAFPTKRTFDHLTVRTVQRIVLTAGRSTLQTRLTPHMLRHTFATRLMRKTNIRIVQQLLGHKSLSSTQIYTHPNCQDLKEAIDTLDAKP